MSRNNIWVHVTIALALILIAAFAGGVRHWQRTTHRSSQIISSPQRTSDPTQTSPTSDDDKELTEVLVRFRPGTTRETIERITANFNDEVEDQIEAVDGLEVIEDEDARSAENVLAQYRALAEVEYA